MQRCVKYCECQRGKWWASNKGKKKYLKDEKKREGGRNPILFLCYWTQSNNSEEQFEFSICFDEET